jgi:sporulation protein YlmC with PRC-barrel domain
MSSLSGTPYSESSAQGARIVGDTPSDNSGPGPDIMAASTLTSDPVRNSAGEDLGKIEDIMLDVRQGRVAYAVLSFGGFLGVGSKLFAVPWSALTLDTDNECFILDVSKERLKEAPGFDKDHWPSMADPRWQSEINTYYGRPAYWEQ